MTSPTRCGSIWRKAALRTGFASFTVLIAAVTINVNTDPNVPADLLFQLERSFPDRNDFLHLEGNSAAHLKSSLIGASVSIPIEDGKLALGQWQSVFFCEFDGPRSRSFRMQFLAG